MFYYKTLISSLETDKCDKYLISFNIATNIASVFFLPPIWALKIAMTLLSMGNRKLSDFIKNVFICDLKMNEGLTGLEQQEVE